ncbi:MAG: GFA family protein [Nevskiaceae bacterium]
MKTGSCLCGDVRFELRGPLDGIIACHCNQSRKQTGHYWASTHSADADLHMLSDGPLRWYRASDTAQRGFCSRCGSSLFWKRDGQAVTSVCAGAIDGPSGLTLTGHIFVADKGDYYSLGDPESRGEYQKDGY